MHTTIIFSIVAGLLAAAPAMANSSKEEKIGVGAGAIVGVAAGGPVGLIIGAAIGAKIGDEFHERNTQVSNLSGSLEGSASRVAQLEGDVEFLNNELGAISSELTRAKSIARPELLALMQAGIEMDLLFRTDEYVLADTTGSRLTELAAALAAMPDVYVKLDGFADERGDETYNQLLSVKRADHVRDVLVSGGVAEERIIVNAHGESPASEQNVDSYALERRVSLMLYIDETPSFASNPGN